MINVLGTLDPKRHSQMDVIGINGIMQCIDGLHERKKIAVPIFGGVSICSVSVTPIHLGRA